jgi:hypothetical protein
LDDSCEIRLCEPSFVCLGIGLDGHGVPCPTELYGLAHGGEGECCFGEPGEVSFLAKNILKAMEFA